MRVRILAGISNRVDSGVLSLATMTRLMGAGDLVGVTGAEADRVRERSSNRTVRTWRITGSGFFRQLLHLRWHDEEHNVKIMERLISKFTNSHTDIANADQSK